MLPINERKTLPKPFFPSASTSNPRSKLAVPDMGFIFRPLSLRRHIRYRTFAADAAAAGIKCLRDRGLDHAVAREKNIRPLLSIKDLIRSEPAKSLPLSMITAQKDSLRVPVRPIEFVRSYPSVFMEFLPGGIGIHPHIKLTSEALDLDADEQLVYTSESYKQELADRLLKLLMITRTNKIPLDILHSLRWDLGLPQDFVKIIVPEFPDYFRVINAKSRGINGELELVCWSNEHAVSVLEKKARSQGKGEYSQGMPIAFPMKFSKGFEMDKKMKKWVEDWQKLPYISPYNNAPHLSANSDESDKWAAAVLHEILNLFVSKKAEKDTVLHLGEFLGLRSRFKRVLHHHPGIFYLSSKNRTYTVVLRDAYKRGMLIQSNQVVTMRNRYIKLINEFKEEHRAVSSSKKEDKVGDVCDSGAKDESDYSDSEVEDEHKKEDVDEDSDDEEVVQKQTPKDVRRNSGGRKGRRSFGCSGSRDRPQSRQHKPKLLTEKRTRI